MRAVGERNFQSEGDRYKENITLSLHYMVLMCKGRRESLVEGYPTFLTGGPSEQILG